MYYVGCHEFCSNAFMLSRLFIFQVKRLNTLKQLKQSIEVLWKELETVPSTTIGQELAKDDAEITFKLSSQNIEALRELSQEVSLQTPGENKMCSKDCCHMNT